MNRPQGAPTSSPSTVPFRLARIAFSRRPRRELSRPNKCIPNAGLTLQRNRMVRDRGRARLGVGLGFVRPNGVPIPQAIAFLGRAVALALATTATAAVELAMANVSKDM